MKKQWVVYIIETESGRLYTGITNDIARRFQEHSQGKKGAKFFNISPPVRILFQEPQKNRAAASRWEAQIKKLSRPQKLRLCLHEADRKSSAFPH